MLRGKEFHRQSREVIYTVDSSMELEAGRESIDGGDIQKRVCLATGFSHSSVSSIIAEKRNIESGELTGFSTSREKTSRQVTKSVADD
jgi:hypothetical protein